MKIEDKVILSEDFENVYFFTSGIFAQLFGVSLYLAINHLGLSLKACGYRYKKLNNQLILRGGLPTNSLEKHLGHILIKRDFGYELKLEIEKDESAYYEWYEAQLAQILMEEQQHACALKIGTKLIETKDIKKISKEIINDKPKAKEEQVATEPIGTRHLLLNEQEYSFLKEWQQDKYPNSIESGFIRGLHLKIACSSA